MSQLLIDLFGRLNGINGIARESVVGRLLDEWKKSTDIRLIRTALVQWCEASADMIKFRAGARETATHYVWPLISSGSGCSVCINEFKDPSEMAAGYATTLHDHRYSFVSMVLSGGYTQIRDAIELRDRCRVSQIYELGRDVMTEGDIVVVHHADFHRLEDIRRSTVTLVVKCPAAKDESISIDFVTHKITRHLPVEARVGRLMQTLSSGT